MREVKNCPKCDVELRDERFCNICGWREVGAKPEVRITPQSESHPVIAPANDTASISNREEVRGCEYCNKQVTIRRGSTILSAFVEYKTEEAVFCSLICCIRFVERREAMKVVSESRLDISDDKQPKLYILDEGEAEQLLFRRR